MHNDRGVNLEDFLNRRLKHRMCEKMKADGKEKLG
jgi:hypothetical protein